MKAGTLVLVLVVLCVQNACSMPLRNDEICETLEKVSRQELINFLKYYISLGYNRRPTQKKSTHWPDISKKLLTFLYIYAMQFQIIDPGMLEHTKKKICFEDGTCIDLGDPGVHPKSSIKF